MSEGDFNTHACKAMPPMVIQQNRELFFAARVQKQSTDRAGEKKQFKN